MSESWIVQMGVDQLPLGPQQPFYNVLVEDGSNRYAAQGKKTIHYASQRLFVMNDLQFVFASSLELILSRCT